MVSLVVLRNPFITFLSTAKLFFFVIDKLAI